MILKFDVIVIGAGPAGASASKILSNNGMNVLLLEKKKVPRIKSCCGLLVEEVKTDIQRIFGLIPDNIYCQNRDVNFLCTSLGRTYYKVDGYGMFSNTYRDKLDEWMAKTSGAQLMDNCEVVDINEKNGICKVQCKKDGAMQCYESRYVICAAGANSRFRRKFDLSYRAIYTGKSIQNIYEGKCGIDKGNYYVTINKKFTDIAFSYFYFKDELLCIGSAWVKNGGTYFENWYNYLCKRYDLKLNLIRTERCCAEHLYGDNKVFYGKGNVLFAGEAAGLMGNWGIGIPIAVKSGEKAALSILKNSTDIINSYSISTNVLIK